MLKPAWSLEMCKLPESSCLACADEPWGEKEQKKCIVRSLLRCLGSLAIKLSAAWSIDHPHVYVTHHSFQFSVVYSVWSKHAAKKDWETWSPQLLDQSSYFCLGFSSEKKHLFFWELPKLPPPTPARNLGNFFSFKKFGQCPKDRIFFWKSPLIQLHIKKSQNFLIERLGKVPNQLGQIEGHI